MRLAFPMLLLTILAAASFWSDINDRVGTTMTILLAISALYIVVFANVPMIGYLTKFDTFVVALFVILFGCCNLHSLTIRFQKEGAFDKYPLRPLYLRLTEFIGRLFVIPITLYMYLSTFKQTGPELIISWTIVAGFILFVGSREFFGIRKVARVTMNNIKVKVISKGNMTHL